MLGDFITRGLILVLAYAYPAFECYKTVEKNRVEIEELRFWCKYWIIVALLTVCERIGDTFISWLPMYGEMKLGFFIYLWYPKTKGTSYVYETFLRPYVRAHETDFDRKLLELRARSWDLAIFYWQNCTQLGQTTFFQILKYLAAQSSKVTNTGTEKADQYSPSAPPLPNRQTKQSSKKKRPPTPPPPPTTVDRNVSQTPISNLIQVHLEHQTDYLHIEDSSMPEPAIKPGPTTDPNTGLDRMLHAARQRLRRHL